MGDLEFVLRQVEILKGDLKAFTDEIIEPAVESYGYHRTFHTEERGCPMPGEEEYWAIDKPAKYAPDTKKREEARIQLNKIYDSSEWYSARYLAGITLRVYLEHLNEQITQWLTEISNGTNSKVTVMREVDVGGDYQEVYGKGGYYNGGSSCEYVPCMEPRPFEEPDEDKRIRSVTDARKLFELSRSAAVKDLLKGIYKKNDVQAVRTSAGQALGYSSLRIWAHELFK